MAAIRKFTLESGQVRWEARIHRRGEAVLSRRFKTEGKAKEWARKVETRLDVGEAAPVRLNSELTVDVAISSFLQHNQITPPTRPHYLCARHDLGPFAIRALTARKIQLWLDKLTGAAPESTRLLADSTARHAFYALKRAVEWHAKHDRYILPVGLFDIDRVPAAWGEPRQRRLLPGEFEALKKAALSQDWIGVPGAVWWKLIELTIETAMRQQEIVLAAWSHLSADGRLISIPPANEKTKNGRIVPLSPRAREIVAELRAARNEDDIRLFEPIQPGQNKHAGKGFAKIAAAAGCPDLTFHDLRHEGTSKLCESRRFDLVQAMSITGHATLTTFKRYVVLLPSRLADAWDD